MPRRTRGRAVKKNPGRLYLRLVRRLFPEIMEVIDWVVSFLERGYYGWSKRDCYSADIYLARIIVEIVKWLKKKKQGVPHDFVMKAAELRIARLADNAAREMTEKDTETVLDIAVDLYDKTLDDIVEGLQAYLQMMDLDWKPGEDINVMILQSHQLERKFRKSMLLLTRYFRSLGI